MTKLLNILCLLEFDGSEPWRIVAMALYMAGLWKILEKSGL